MKELLKSDTICQSCAEMKRSSWLTVYKFNAIPSKFIFDTYVIGY